MAAQLIRPDLDFVRQILSNGGESLKKCYQCATCSVVCQMTPDAGPFPRKEMLLAQWGLREQLAASLDIWLCHNCNDCSAACPRRANPGDVLAAIRQYVMVDLAMPRGMSGSVRRPTYLAGVGGVFVFLAWLPLADWQNAFLIAGGAALGITLNALRRFWKAIQRSGGTGDPEARNSAAEGAGVAPAKQGFMRSLDGALTDILSHRHFKRCGAERGRFSAHLLIFYGFASLFLTCFGAQLYSLTGAGLPLPLTNPLKILGMLGGVALLAGLTLMITGRLHGKAQGGRGTYFDWVFLMSLYLLTTTGLAMPLLRLAGATAWVHSLYLLHLAFLFLSVAWFPFSKFMHPLYRILALTYAKQVGREREARGPLGA